MEKLNMVCKRYGFSGECKFEIVNLVRLSPKIPSKYVDGELYVDTHQLWESLGLNKLLPMLDNVKLIDFKYLDNCGLIDNSSDDSIILLGLNQMIKTYGDKYELNPLMKHTSSITFFIDENTINTTFLGLGGKYKEYVTHLIEGINKIDLSNIDITDVMNFELSDENKVFSTQKINVTDLKPNEKCFSINEEDFINYLLHILPQYLPSDVKLHPSVISIINDDEDDVSVEFRDKLWKKSNQYLIGMKTYINSIGFQR